MPSLINCQIINAQLPGQTGLYRLTLDRQGLIAAIRPMPAPSQPTARTQHLTTSTCCDVEGDWISLGGVDLQINGALGLAFPELSLSTVDRLPEICQFLWDQGIDGFLPTIVTTSIENIQRSLSVLAAYQSSSTAQSLGVHLEGPFLNPDKRGAHPAEYLLPLTLDTVKQVLGDYASTVKVMTLAPELDPTGEVVPALRSLGMTVSLGHSLATSTQAQQAFAQGATMVTHAFNAMPGLHHRQPGLLGAAIIHPQVVCGLIADGQHVHPLMIEVLLRASYGDRGVFLVSDALAPLGLPEGVYPWDNRQIQIKNGTARLPDGTLAGTTLPLLAGVQNLVQWGICDVGTAIALATETPRRAIGLPGLAIGQPAHLLRWRHDPTTGELTWQRL
jgi:N-acetylglucosamine-6-phosphate deacetylase